MAHIVDTHTHSNFSPDSFMRIGEALKYAKMAGLSGIAITDHLDLKAPGGVTRFTFNPDEQQKEADLYRTSVSNVQLFTGIEIGLQPKHISDIQEFVRKFSFDTIIASVHFVDGVDPYEEDYYVGKEKKRSYGRYLEIIYEVITKYKDYDILGHFDYIARYSPYRDRGLYYRDFPDHLDSILRNLIENGKSLEVNTNTYRFRNDKAPVLDTNILFRYRELGGDLISIGSDAHSKERIGDNFDYYLDIIRGCGFRYITYFNKRKAVPERF